MKRGFSFLEILIALAILALVSSALAPLLTNLTAADTQGRTRAAAWRAIQGGITASHLKDERMLKEANGSFTLKWVQASATGTVEWVRVSAVPEKTDMPAAETHVRSAPPEAARR